MPSDQSQAARSPSQEGLGSNLIIWGFAALLLIANWSAILYKIYDERQVELGLIYRNNANLARVFEEHTIRTIGSVDQAIQFLSIQYEKFGDRIDIPGLVKDGLLDRDLITQLGIINDQGIYSHGTHMAGIGMDLSAREHFRVHVADDSGQLFIGSAHIGKVTQAWSMAFSRRIIKRDGSFGGVAMVALDPQYLASFYRQVDLGKQGVVALVGANSKVRARRQGDEMSFGQDWTGSPVLQAAFAQGTGTIASVSPIDGVKRLHSFRKVKDYPLWIIIATSEEEALDVTNERAGLYQLFGGVLTLLILSFSLAMAHDITRRKQAQDRIKELAFFDQLTGLPNRTLLQDRLKQALVASSRNDSFCALLLIDLDNFKTLNDTRGHDFGDLLLKETTQRLLHGVREGATVARLGGDEFMIVLSGLNADQADAATASEVVAEKILAALNQDYTLDAIHHHSSASIGITLFKGDLVGIDELMKQADLAMYKSKKDGRNQIRFFDPELESSVKERANMEADLRLALLRNQLLLHYQPQVAGDRQLTGAEVLVRWQHPTRGMVSPADFIPLAEENGLILPLGHWVLETACTQLAIWAGQPTLAHLTIAVNVSTRQIHHADFVDQVLAILDSTGANPRLLKLELTESVLVENIQDIIDKMFTLKSKGVNFSLDDFGTGFSSLSYLKQLPLDQLKIDRSFVRDVLVDPNDAAIAKTVIALAQSLGLGVIAEGVETVAQMEFLATSGCHAYQGYYFSRPLPLEAFEEFARQG